MESGQPSRTAVAAAMYRAAHQVLDRGRIFADPLALRILGMDVEAMARNAKEHPTERGLRLFIAARTRFAEDALATAVAHGVRQLVVLGAGLDTLAYRTALGDRLRIFEVDHPATQAWKRERLAATAIPLPSALTFAPVDFERETLADGLMGAGFDPARRTFFTWLGVTPYLTEEAVFSTLRFVASLPGGAHVVFDYSNPPASISGKARAAHETLAARAAAVGEAFKSYFETDSLGAELTRLGFVEVEDLGSAQILARYVPEQAVSFPASGGHIVHAATV